MRLRIRLQQREQLPVLDLQPVRADGVAYAAIRVSRQSIQAMTAMVTTITRLRAAKKTTASIRRSRIIRTSPVSRAMMSPEEAVS